MRKSLLRTVLSCALSGVILTGGATSAVATPITPGHLTAQNDATLQQRIDDHSPSAEVLIAAHRADWRDTAENSLAAIETAISNGAEIIELDVQVTSDGIPVLMHDKTVDRTTTETGPIGSFTAEEVTQLRLLKHMGRDKGAVLTEETVPTFEEAMNLVRGRAIVNIDKGWENRHAIAEVLQRTGTEEYALMKGASTVEDAVEFMKQYPAIRYAHVLDDHNADHGFAFPKNTQPTVWEVVFNEDADVQAQPEYLSQLKETGRVWINTMWDTLAAGNTDEASLRQAEGQGWQNLVDNYYATILQTDNVEAMNYWTEGGSLDAWEKLPGNDSIRIQPERDIVEQESYDVEPNLCAQTTPHLAEVDVCDGSSFNHTRNALALSHTEPGEIVTMRFDVQKPGRYQVLARTGGQHADAGRIQFSWDGEDGAMHKVQHTSHLGIFLRDDVEQRFFTEGEHTVSLLLDPEHRQYFTLDYVQLDYLGQNSAPPHSARGSAENMLSSSRS